MKETQLLSFYPTKIFFPSEYNNVGFADNGSEVGNDGAGMHNCTNAHLLLAWLNNKYAL